MTLICIIKIAKSSPAALAACPLSDHELREGAGDAVAELDLDVEVDRRAVELEEDPLAVGGLLDVDAGEAQPAGPRGLAAEVAHLRRQLHLFVLGVARAVDL